MVSPYCGHFYFVRDPRTPIFPVNFVTKAPIFPIFDIKFVKIYGYCTLITDCFGPKVWYEPKDNFINSKIFPGPDLIKKYPCWTYFSINNLSLGS